MESRDRSTPAMLYAGVVGAVLVVAVAHVEPHRLAVGDDVEDHRPQLLELVDVVAPGLCHALGRVALLNSSGGREAMAPLGELDESAAVCTRIPLAPSPLRGGLGRGFFFDYFICFCISTSLQETLTKNLHNSIPLPTEGDGTNRNFWR